MIEIDEATLRPFRTAKDPATQAGKVAARQGKMRIADREVELSPEGEPRRIRLAPMRKAHRSARSLHAFVAEDLGAGRAGDQRCLERLLRLLPAPRPPRPRSTVQRPPISC